MSTTLVLAVPLDHFRCRRVKELKAILTEWPGEHPAVLELQRPNGTPACRLLLGITVDDAPELRDAVGRWVGVQ